ncbi:3'-5' exonuclease [Corynebacterium sp. CCUG 71335]|uniref:3'-5' exonuclease n=1 Tax=Corynebacterium sp. CCUG 71335 TaxID=2823892 RepID=UPI00210BA17F|nr:exonuclease domain-containing protein [Corynebacterium sp. CCUG 71335]MCQ4618171.1 3'-5' exonuclease [Corynebacterium pseudogenitalium]MCQ4620233.1 3'-5' exonuclease [Corynebacterium sp. CCUG 71335]
MLGLKGGGLFGPPKRDIVDGQLLAVDVETTGLKPDKHHLVSIGWVPVTDRVIDLSGAGYFVLAGASVGDSATVHGVTDDDIAREGVDAQVALDAFLQAIEGRALLAHFAQMETGFIDALHKRVYGKRFRLRADEVVDTLSLERRHMERMATYPRGEDLRLARVRSRYNLPDYGNHNALTDALACAELYLALTAK